MSDRNPHSMATYRSYRRAADWVREHHPDVWVEIHREERTRLGLSRDPMFGPDARGAKTKASTSGAR